jgi:ribonuclease/clavin/mitogillin
MNIVNVGYHSTNYYALEINVGKLLIDCGWPGTLPQFTAEMKRKSISPGETQYILVTHFHLDHAGLVQDFKDRGAKLILMESQVGFIAPLNNLIKTKYVPYTELREDDNLDLKFADSREFLATLGLAGEIISTPGHSDDSVTLILDEGLAFTGDLRSRFLVPEEDRVTRDSWDRIYQHQIRKIYPAHGS